MTNVAIFAASDLEYNLVKVILSSWEVTNYQPPLLSGQGFCGNTFVELFCTKMGPKNAAQQAKIALDNTKANLLIITGLAGGLSTECQQGDLVIYKNCYFLPGDNARLEKPINCDQKLISLITNTLRSNSFTIHQGDGITLPWVVCKADQKKSLAKSYKTIAVDMESYQILTAAKEKSLPATVLRVISDDASRDLPNINLAMNEMAEVNNLKMLVELAKHPILAARFLLNLNKSISVLKNCLPKVLNQSFQEVL
ncbi:MAG: hypothetical protein WAQ98_16415 [Blastocatellia bacterium]